MQTYWDIDSVNDLPSYLGHVYPRSFVVNYGDESVVRLDMVNGKLLLFDKPGLMGKISASQSLNLNKELRQTILYMLDPVSIRRM